MEIEAKSPPTGSPLSNVGVVGKTIKIAISPSATDEEIDEFIDELRVKRQIGDSANVIFFDDCAIICVRPICPFCDMDFGSQSFLHAHIQQDTCLVS